MHGLAVYVKEVIPFAWNLSVENSVDFYLCFQLALLHSPNWLCLTSFSPINHVLHLFAGLLILFHLT